MKQIRENVMQYVNQYLLSRFMSFAYISISIAEVTFNCMQVLCSAYMRVLPGASKCSVGYAGYTGTLRCQQVLCSVYIQVLASAL